jgi:hypothetical protein
MYIVSTSVLDNGILLASLYYANSGTRKPWRSLLHTKSSQDQQSSATAITCAQQLLQQHQLQQHQSDSDLGTIVCHCVHKHNCSCARTTTLCSASVADDIV